MVIMVINDMTEMIKQFRAIMCPADSYYSTPPKIPINDKQIPMTLGKYFYRVLELSMTDTGRYNEAEIIMKCVSNYLATLDDTKRDICYPDLEKQYYKRLVCIDTWRDVSQLCIFIIGLLNDYLLPLYTTETIRTNIQVLIEKLDMAAIFCHNRIIYQKLDRHNNIVPRGRNDYIMARIDGRWKPKRNTLLMLVHFGPNNIFNLPYNVDINDILDKVGDGTSVATITDIYRYFLYHYDDYVDADRALSDLRATSLGLSISQHDACGIHRFVFSPSIFVLRQRYPTCRNIDIDKVLSSEMMANSYLKWAHQFCPIDIDMLPPIEEYIYRFVFSNIQEIIPKPQKSARK